MPQADWGMSPPLIHRPRRGRPLPPCSLWATLPGSISRLCRYPGSRCCRSGDPGLSSGEASGFITCEAVTYYLSASSLSWKNQQLAMEYPAARHRISSSQSWKNQQPVIKHPAARHGISITLPWQIHHPVNLPTRIPQTAMMWQMLPARTKKWNTVCMYLRLLML